MGLRELHTNSTVEDLLSSGHDNVCTRATRRLSYTVETQRIGVSLDVTDRDDAQSQPGSVAGNRRRTGRSNGRDTSPRNAPTYGTDQE